LRSGEGSVGIGCRRFIVDDKGRLVRLRNAIFERLLRVLLQQGAAVTLSR
jgi:hypothetical protein